MAKRRRKKASGTPSPRAGVAGAGTPIDPSNLPDDDAGRRNAVRDAPAPGVPVSAEQLKRLKALAERRAPRARGSAQKDPAGE
jgi:hypothetical protein